tara:strand:+ start:1019 stop:1384 length:366 start_codon:yes stop_codon:yes gene_type:complete
MERLSSELYDLILFPKYFKPITELSFNEKIYLSKCFENINNINNQIKSLVQEHNYHRTRCGCNIWKNTKKSVYKYILYKTLQKKKFNLSRYLLTKNELINYDVNCNKNNLKYNINCEYKIN